MPYLMDRLRLTLCLALTCLIIAGCQDGPGDEYQTYQAIEESDGSGDDSLADGSLDAEVADEEGSSATEAVPNEIAVSVSEQSEDASTNELTEESPSSLDNSPAENVVQTEPADDEASLSPEEPLAPELVNDAAASPAADLPVSEPNLFAVSDVPVEQREIKLLIPEKSFTSEGDADALRVSYDDVNLLDILNMDPVPIDAETYFPNWLAGLEGQRIRIRGFMYPAFQSTGLRTFVLVRDNQECCFGPGAKIYDHIQVTMRDGVTTDYIQGRAFDVEGIFHILPEADEDELYQLYLLDDALVLDQ